MKPDKAPRPVTQHPPAADPTIARRRNGRMAPAAAWALLPWALTAAAATVPPSPPPLADLAQQARKADAHARDTEAERKRVCGLSDRQHALLQQQALAPGAGGSARSVSELRRLGADARSLAERCGEMEQEARAALETRQSARDALARAVSGAAPAAAPAAAAPVPVVPSPAPAPVRPAPAQATAPQAPAVASPTPGAAAGATAVTATAVAAGGVQASATATISPAPAASASVTVGTHGSSPAAPSPSPRAGEPPAAAPAPTAAVSDALDALRQDATKALPECVPLLDAAAKDSAPAAMRPLAIDCARAVVKAASTSVERAKKARGQARGIYEHADAITPEVLLSASRLPAPPSPHAPLDEETKRLRLNASRALTTLRENPSQRVPSGLLSSANALTAGGLVLVQCAQDPDRCQKPEKVSADLVRKFADCSFAKRRKADASCLEELADRESFAAALVRGIWAEADLASNVSDAEKGLDEAKAARWGIQVSSLAGRERTDALRWLQLLEDNPTVKALAGGSFAGIVTSTDGSTASVRLGLTDNGPWWARQWSLGFSAPVGDRGAMIASSGAGDRTDRPSVLLKVSSLRTPQSTQWLYLSYGAQLGYNRKSHDYLGISSKNEVESLSRSLSGWEAGINIGLAPKDGQSFWSLGYQQVRTSKDAARGTLCPVDVVNPARCKSGFVGEPTLRAAEETVTVEYRRSFGWFSFAPQVRYTGKSDDTAFSLPVYLFRGDGDKKPLNGGIVADWQKSGAEKGWRFGVFVGSEFTLGGN